MSYCNFTAGNIRSPVCNILQAKKSFRQTIHGKNVSDRGFIVKINRPEKKILISFDSSKVTETHKFWLNDVKKFLL
jgi:hypothetical protein